MQRALISILVMGLAGCAPAAPETRPEPGVQTWLALRGPPDWIASEPMSLEIAERGWQITSDGGLGVVTPNLTGPAEVRLIGVETCREYAALDIAPGSAWIIRFATDGSVIVEDAAGQAQEMGPGLVDGPRSSCEPAA